MSLLSKIYKYTGWILLVLIVIYIVTGFSYAGYFGFENFINPALATTLHSNLIVVGILIIATFLHCCLRTIMAFKNRSKSPAHTQQTIPQSAPQPPPQDVQQPAE